MNFDNIKLDKGLYTGGNFNGQLEKIDPSANYIGTEMEGMDAFQRQLKRFDIKANGANSDRVEKFFSTQDSAVLFPEYVSRCVRVGLESNNFIKDIVAAITSIESMDYRSIATDTNVSERSLANVSEGAYIPETVVKTKDNIITLRKRGRALVASYEAIKFQRLDVFSVTLKQIGQQIAKTLLNDAIDVAINGDGNNNAAEVISLGSAVTYNGLIDLWNKFDPYELNTMIASPTAMAEILKLSEFKDSVAGLNFHATGKMVTPFGASLYKSADLSGKKILALDKNAALEMIKCGEIMTEYDKLIDRQLDRAVISMTAGFAKIFNGATNVMQ